MASEEKKKKLVSSNVKSIIKAFTVIIHLFTGKENGISALFNSSGVQTSSKFKEY